jgi:hypothetical protein
VRLISLEAGAPPDLVVNEPDGVVQMVVHRAVDGGWQ